ncbi:MAG: transporter [Clostridia bacterium]|jgi:PPP family 3-phenylpropionic acid transporter|nr:transporter [Clostridia bacterium]
MNKHSKSIMFFALMQGFYWAACVTFNVFLVFYLETLHIPSSQIGLLLTAGMVVGVTSQYFWGYLCDYLNGIKKVISLCIIGTVMAVWSLSTVQNYHAILIIYIIFMLFQPVIPSLIDTWIIQLSKSSRKNYSKLRGIGSLTFAVMSSFFGVLVEKYFYNAMAIGFTVFNVLLFITVILSEDIAKDPKDTNREKEPKQRPAVLFTNIKFTAFLLGVTLILIPNSFITSYMFYIAESVNGSAREMGLTFGLAAILEIPLFLMFERIIKRISLEKLLIIGSVFLIGRIFQLMFITTPSEMYVNALFHGAGFPLLISCLRNYVPTIVPKSLTVTGQAVAGAFAAGVPYIIATSLGGSIIQNYSLTSCYIIFSLLGCLALIPFVYLSLTSAKSESTITSLKDQSIS